MVNIKPVLDRIVVEPLTDTKTPGGLHIPDRAADRSCRGRVVAVGPGRVESGCLISPQVRVGDVIAFRSHTSGVSLATSHDEIVVDGAKYLVMHEADVLAVFS